MSRAVVFKTKGKLDLRSLTVFGMNSKPTTTTPIGYFGTGLKYALAVLAREKIPVTFWIDGKKWIVESDPAKFRDKEFTELYICSTTIGGLIKKRIKLPYTTELGKNWKLWQAFRELESNTRDEKGETFIDDTGQLDNTEHPIGAKGLTYIVVESEAFVEEYLDRDKTFLPDGLTQRVGTEDVQVFDRPSDAIYYRGIRVLDLDEKERSELTYNILRHMELTEDRTLKSKWDAEYYIGIALARSKEAEHIQKAITAPTGTFENRLNFSYSTPSVEFLDTVASSEDKVHPSAKSVLKTHRPPPRKQPTLQPDWRSDLLQAIKDGDYDKVEEVIDAHRKIIIALLEKDIERNPTPLHVELPVGSSDDTTQEESATKYGEPNWKEPEDDNTRGSTESVQRVDELGDDIPF